ncbi:MAG: phosphoribosylamine--glycine ligase [Deltaproteobacteria bacterium]|nr:phosphoribosylamine--glycine ligase [Deltaproteobacteria bacterium]
MKILVIGSGGREHALVWKIAQSPLAEKIYCAPGNPGIAALAECLPIAVDRIEELLTFARENAVDLTVVGPELPLTLGIVDRFRAAGLAIFGPDKKAAQLEGSKAFSKQLMARYGIPTAAFATFSDFAEAEAYIRSRGAPIVVKADGLAAGKGVYVAQTVDEALQGLKEIMVECAFGEAGRKVVVEEFLDGEEASFFAFTDGRHILPLAACQDHKAAYDNDTGPNTGGMGAYCPAPVVTPALYEKIVTEVVRPTIDGMAAEGCPYRGILFIGLMIKGAQIKVLEYNVRFGDPETQPLLMRMKSDLVPVLMACAGGELEEKTLQWHPQTAVCVVMASGGYPGAYQKGFEIQGLEETAGMGDLFVFHAGTDRAGGRIVNVGGRVLGVTGLGSDTAAAIERAYKGVEKIRWEGVHYRRDIGHKALRNKGA